MPNASADFLLKKFRFRLIRLFSRLPADERSDRTEETELHFIIDYDISSLSSARI